MKTLLLCLNDDKVSNLDRERIALLLPDARLVITRNEAVIADVLPEVEIVAGWLPREQMLEAKRLKWMQQWWAGADWILKRPEMKENGVVVTTASGIHAIQITEHIFSFLFAFARDLPAARAVQLGGTWKQVDDPKVFELFGKTLLVIGVGEIGSRTAEIGRALGMRVIGVRRNPDRPAPAIEHMFGPNQLDEALPQADFVAVVTPLTNETRGMIGHRELGLMKKSSIIVNVGRGAAIDEQALTEALKEQKIAGAGLDTFEMEPLPESSPLWKITT